MIQFLLKSYNLFEDKKFRLWLTLGSSLFIFLFLYSIQPFGIRFLPAGEKFFYALFYALITLMVCAINVFLLQTLLLRKFNVIKTILWNSWIIMSIGVANGIAISLYERQPVSMELLFTFQGYTLVPGLLISTLAILIHYNLVLRKRLIAAEKTNKNLYIKEEIPIIDCQENLYFHGISVHQILFITSADNYIEICFFENNKKKRKLIRGTLDKAEQQLSENEHIIRCHRSYIVNTNFISTINGNAAGYILKIQKCDEEVPVSRKYKDNLFVTLNKTSK